MKKVFTSKEEAVKGVMAIKAILREKGINSDNIPDYLKERPQWVTWMWQVRDNNKGGFVTTKVPINCETGKLASHSSPHTWFSFEIAVAKFSELPETSGIGYVISKDDNIVGIDFDNCINDQKDIHPEVLEILEPYECYTEASPSMTGLKVLGIGDIDANLLNTEAGSGFKIHNFPIDGMDVEVYQHSRFFTITSMKLKSKPSDIISVQPLVDALLKKRNGELPDFQAEFDNAVIEEPVVETSTTVQEPETDTSDFVAVETSTTAEEPVKPDISEEPAEQPPEEPAEEPAKEPVVSDTNSDVGVQQPLNNSFDINQAKNLSQKNRDNGAHKIGSAEFIKDKILSSRQSGIFRTLFDGNVSNYPSHSEADLALTSILCWWCQGDRSLAEQIFASSKLVREKWTNRQDYRDGLWNKVDTGQYYMPKELSDPKDLPPILSLERQIDFVSKWLVDSEDSSVVKDSVRYDGYQVVLDVVLTDTNGQQHTIPRLLVSDYVCIGLGIPPMSKWKRDNSGKFADKESKGFWRDINNFAAEIVGNTGGWGKSINNRHAAAAEAAMEVLGF